MVNQFHIDLPAGVTSVTPFLLVFGTLRLGQGNWKRYLQNTKHIGTYKLPKWGAVQIFSAYTGKEKDYVVVDLFDLRYTTDNVRLSELALYELNAKLDMLEGTLRHGNYTCTLMQITVEDTTSLAKFYNANANLESNKLQKDFVTKEVIDYPEIQLHEIPVIPRT